MNPCTHIAPFRPSKVRSVLSIEMMTLAQKPIPGREHSCLITALKRLISPDVVHAWNMVCMHVTNYPSLVSEDAKMFFLEVAVDAFLNHDYAGASGFYNVYLLSTALLRQPYPEKLLQSSLELICKGDPSLKGAVTPWGTPYVGYPQGTTMSEVMAPMLSLKEELTLVAQGEAELLEVMLKNKDITCSCLNAEDPNHPDFGTGETREDVAKNWAMPANSSTPKPYMTTCVRCLRAPKDKPFPRCSNCHRVRYCSRECQKKHWKEHKPRCKQKTAAWWGKANTMSLAEARSMGVA